MEPQITGDHTARPDLYQYKRLPPDLRQKGLHGPGPDLPLLELQSRKPKSIDGRTRFPVVLGKLVPLTLDITSRTSKIYPASQVKQWPLAPGRNLVPRRTHGVTLPIRICRGRQAAAREKAAIG